MSNKRFIKVAAVSGILACIIDFVITYILATYYPGYSHLTDTMSKLGATNSPVGKLISGWWLVLCIMLLVFTLGFYLKYKHHGRQVILPTILIGIYALGEGMGSGLFPANYVKNGITLSLLIHDTFSGIGVGSIILLPVFMLKLFPRHEFKSFFVFTLFVSIFGPLMLILFSLAKLYNNPENIILFYKGLWQRLMMANYYAYLIVIAVFMLSEIKSDK